MSPTDLTYRTMNFLHAVIQKLYGKKPSKRRGRRKERRVEVKAHRLFFQDIQWRRETIKEETTSVCLKREFSEEDARQLGLGRRIGVRRGYNSSVVRKTKKREPRLDASSPRQSGAEVCTQPVSPPSQLQLATFQHAASSRLYGL